MTNPEVLNRCLERERLARKEAERLLEERSRQLYQANQELLETAYAYEDQIRRTQAIVDSAAEAIVIFDSRGGIESFNPAAEAMFGCSAEDARGWNIANFLPDVPFGCQDGEEGQILWSDGVGEVTGRKADGQNIPLELVIGSFEHGAQRFFTALMRDMTKRLQLETQLSHAQKMESVGQLAAGIAHEINTPIQYVGDNTRFLKNSFDDMLHLLDKFQQLLDTTESLTADAQLHNEIRHLQESIDIKFLQEEIPAAIAQTLEGAESVAKIVRAMKDFSHPGSEEKQQINLNQAVESTLVVSRNVWKYCCDLVTEFDQSLPLVPCLPGDFNQALLNLVTNAAHAIESAISSGNIRKGTLTVRTAREDQWAVIEVQDTGTGIHESIRTRIFDPFFTTKPMGQGTGQGLAITYNIIVEKHGGELTFDSEVGVGTKFRIRIPLVERDQDEIQVRAPKRLSGGTYAYT